MKSRPRIFSLMTLLIIVLTTSFPSVSQAQFPKPSAVVHKIYMPAMAFHVDRFVGLAINQSSFQTYEATIQGAQAAVGTNFAVLHTPWAWTYDFAYNTSDFTVLNGSVPFIAWESGDASSAGGCQAAFSLQNIMNGAFDTYIHNFARSVADWGHTVFIDYGAEMNLNHAWSGYCNGGANGGPQRYVAVYRRLHDIFVQEGATNVRWVWSPAPDDFPKEDWNKLENYYPGDAYVDWLGIKVFNWGATSSFNGNKWLSFDQIVGAQIKRIQAVSPGKPVYSTETGSVDGDGGSQAAWINDMFDALEHYPQIRAVNYYNYTFAHYPSDGRVYDFAMTNDANARAAFGRGVKQYNWNQHMYDGAQAVKPFQPQGNGASLGAEINIPPMSTIASFNSTAKKDHSTFVLYADWRAAAVWTNGYSGIYNSLPASATPLMMWQPFNIKLGDIINSKYDAFLKDWALGLKGWGRTAYIAWAPAPNNNQNCPTVTWCGASNNSSGTLYIDAYRHIINTFRNNGVTNVRWVFLPSFLDIMPNSYYTQPQAWKRGDARWNAFYNYYPGNDYIDWIGIDVFNSGNNTSLGTYWAPPFTLFDHVLTYSKEHYPLKPQLVLLTSVDESGNPNHKAGWIRDAYTLLKDYSNVQLVLWKENFRLTGNGSITSSPQALATYQQVIADPYYRSTAP